MLPGKGYKSGNSGETWSAGKRETSPGNAKQEKPCGAWYIIAAIVRPSIQPERTVAHVGVQRARECLGRLGSV